MIAQNVSIAGTVVSGHGQAARTIPRQTPLFLNRGLDISWCHPATLNVALDVEGFRLVNPLTLTNVCWDDPICEDFSFCPAKLEFAESFHDVLVYQPHPETKPDHFQPANVVELLAKYIEGLKIGAAVRIHFGGSRIRLLS